MEIIKSVIIELRPRLRCCNIFLTTTRLLLQDQLIITIRPDCIIFNCTKYSEVKGSRSSLVRKYSTSSESDDDSCDYSNFMSIKQFCKLVPGSLTNLKIENNSVSFRVLSEPSGPNASGSFHSEIVNGNDLLNDKYESNMWNLNLKKNTSITIHCSNCSNQISRMNPETDNSVMFHRVLELPSECIDMSDWFCHVPGKPCGHNSKKAPVENCNYNKFEPTEFDIYYGASYLLVNSTILNETIVKFNSKRDVLHCNRCLSYLGPKIASGNVFKFWNANIKFSDITNQENVFFHMFSYKECICNTDLVLQDTINLLKHAIKDSSIGFQIPVACKIILETDDLKKQYLFLWVLDKSLDVLKSLPNIAVNSEMKEIKLASITASKVLYFASNEAALKSTEEWNCPSVQVISVSKNMVVAILSYLVDNSKSIPESFRRTSTYYVSYIYN